ncbi:MAG: plasmid pRiA4b ORF-3 family protein [Desulfovibrio sp.]|jgi:hypothetical protein|nr:plasmid pRiA4b ORF-3 family protein [Desulfovibrio sp.]
MCPWIEKAPAKAEKNENIYRFNVALINGPVTPEFLQKNPEAPSRTIDIKGNQKLSQLHDAIFKAYDRYDHHLYEFQIGGKRPADRKAVCYGLPTPDDFFEDDGKTLNAGRTSIASLQLKKRQKFFYWFDFGDDWWHSVTLLSITPQEAGDRKRYPRIVAKQGDSPPQYAEWEDDNWEGEQNP